VLQRLKMAFARAAAAEDAPKEPAPDASAETEAAQ
jgi:hypothetical protein